MNPLNAIRGSDRVRQRWRHALVIFEIATTVALLVSTGAMLSSYRKKSHRQPGVRYSADPQRPRQRSGRPRPATVARSVADIAGYGRGRSCDHGALPCDWRALRVSSDPDTVAPRRSPRRRDGPQYFSTLNVPMRAGRMFNGGRYRRQRSGGGGQRCAGHPAVAFCRWRTRRGNWQAGIHRGAPAPVIGVVAGYAMTAIQPAAPPCSRRLRSSNRPRRARN